MQIPKINEIIRRQSTLTLQQRLTELKGAKLNILIAPFGNIEDAKITKVTGAFIVLTDIILSPSGLQVISISRRAKNPTKSTFDIGVNSKVNEGAANSAAILPKRRVVQIGIDFIETTVDGKSIQLIPLSNVTIIFPSVTRAKRLSRFRKSTKR